MQENIAILRPSTYSYLIDDSDENTKAKSTNTYFRKLNLKPNAYNHSFKQLNLKINRNCVKYRYFHTMKLSEITVFYAVKRTRKK